LLDDNIIGKKRKDIRERNDFINVLCFKMGNRTVRAGGRS